MRCTWYRLPAGEEGPSGVFWTQEAWPEETPAVPAVAAYWSPTWVPVLADSESCFPCRVGAAAGACALGTLGRKPPRSRCRASTCCPPATAGLSSGTSFARVATFHDSCGWEREMEREEIKKQGQCTCIHTRTRVNMHTANTCVHTNTCMHACTHTNMAHTCAPHRHTTRTHEHTYSAALLGRGVFVSVIGKALWASALWTA